MYKRQLPRLAPKQVGDPVAQRLIGVGSQILYGMQGAVEQVHEHVLDDVLGVVTVPAFVTARDPAEQPGPLLVVKLFPVRRCPRRFGVHAFFHPLELTVHHFPNVQWLDFESLKGQLLSASYIPLPGHQSYNTMINELIHLFIAYNENGFVQMEFETKLYINL